MPVRLLISVLALAVLSACSPDDVLKKFATDADRNVATQCINLMRTGKLEELESKLEPSLKTPSTHATMVRMSQVMPPGKPDALKLVGARLDTDGSDRTSNLTYEYTFGTRNFLVNCATRTQGSEAMIVGINVETLSKSVEEQSRFDWKGKSPVHYAVALAGAAFVLLSLFALILCIVDKGLRRKWLWIIFILFGIGEISLNWTTGAWSFSLLHFLLFSASAVSAGYGPWEVSIALPLGAIVYLTRRFLNHRSTPKSNDD